MPSLTPPERILALARKRGVLRLKDVTALGIHPEYVRRLVSAGRLMRTGRGLYVLAEADLTESHSLVEAVRRVPDGIVCLLSALQFHRIGTQMPHQVWLALSHKARLPRTDSSPLRIVRFSGTALRSGIEKHRIEGIDVRVYSPAKTVADCFKYRNKIGLDVALEALREGWRRRRFSMDELWSYAKVCRVANVMRPYLEGLP
ncbi:MAG: type IV toxin-antitoxin system AbiEi family antitoxin domain-containing protein [Chloroflexota bacterium]